MLLPLQLLLACVAGVASHQVVLFAENGTCRLQPFYGFIWLSSFWLALLRIWAVMRHLNLWKEVSWLLLPMQPPCSQAWRILLHRLRRFPGPFWAVVSKFWHVIKCLQTNSQNHLILDGLHQKYGDFVRTGTRTSEMICTEASNPCWHHVQDRVKWQSFIPRY